MILPDGGRRGPHRGRIAAVPTRMPRAFRPTGAPPTRTAQGNSCQSEPRKLAQGPGHRQGSSGKMAATGYFARSRWMPNRPHRTRRSRVHCTQKRKFSTSTKAMAVDVEPAKKPAKKTRWGLRPGRSILPWECGSGARRPHARSKPEAPPHVWVLPGGGGRPTRFQKMQVACQSWQRRRLFTRWGSGDGAGRAFGCFFQPLARQTQPPLAPPLGPTDARGGAIDRPLL